MTCALVWFRQDLRLADNPAWWEACCSCAQVIPVFIDDPTPTSVSQLGAASRVWLHHSLASLDKALQAQGSRLILRQGSALAVLQTLIQETGATHLFWNRCYDPASLARDKQIKATLKNELLVQSFNAALLREPWQVLKHDGQPYKVYTPFWKALLKTGITQELLPEPHTIPKPSQWPNSIALKDLQLLPKMRWDQEMMQTWQVGELAALKRLTDFLEGAVAAYKTARDQPAILGTSRLSPHLHFGEISPRQIAFLTQQYLAEHPESSIGVQHFLQEIAWREFAWYLLYHFPQTVTEPLDQRFKNFQWEEGYEVQLQRWQQGQTGIPLVDAGMRELWQTGWMHNRVRMIVASFLTKNLLIPWQAGEAWFRDTLVDADLANNILGWQWVAGCGADAAPYFRIFNPILQGEKFDPQGDYVRTWVPELAGRAAKEIHHPRVLGDGWKYPLPITDLALSRQLALERYAQIKT
ncbi:deoxyribodipyrimidine photo-lyase [uncultured Thiothrix sp.]|uniref:cryptochrome/photolyase family protein n=1 Tax=uncultured Thiothrix sp. TaxID=223185 RepID=UPI002602EDFF|nr:deoxyribodipyrimidine photo-lyase [uncultured Thiothrix sp.]